MVIWAENVGLESGKVALERLNQPGIVGEIFAGVLLGPSVFGWLAPSEFLGALADLGAMFLLFRVGGVCEKARSD